MKTKPWNRASGSPAGRLRCRRLPTSAATRCHRCHILFLGQIDVRIIAASNRDLEQAMRDGNSRPVLNHRLNVFPIRVPPLRERREDIPPLVWAFVESFGRRTGKSPAPYRNRNHGV